MKTTPLSLPLLLPLLLLWLLGLLRPPLLLPLPLLPHLRNAEIVIPDKCLVKSLPFLLVPMRQVLQMWYPIRKNQEDFAS